MGAKRPFSDVDGSASQQNGANKKRQPPFKSHYRSNENNPSKPGQSLNEIKKRARNIERRFAKGDDLPADVTQKLKRELVQCKRQIDDLQYKKKRQDMISKYHRVRFFERQKAERLRKKLKKQLDEATDPEEKAKIQADYHIADVDWHYTRFFPFLERYESLYSAEKAKEDSDGQTIAMRALHSARPPMWKVVEEALEKGQAALDALQERRSDKTISEEIPVEKASKDSSSGAKSRKERRAALNNPDRSRGKHGEVATEDNKTPGEDGNAADGDGSGFFG
ncbi:rRNA-processing protein EFG1 [Cytospora mali]|uniref:rRNA-processing protein EFG1 n=1 Tax=Cytospora mali TaxID=578113 RepID=A0A194VMM8_CYTMA|nr:rRNA-processing protein EFG1 [Valsa mali]